MSVGLNWKTLMAHSGVLATWNSIELAKSSWLSFSRSGFFMASFKCLRHCSCALLGSLLIASTTSLTNISVLYIVHLLRLILLVKVRVGLGNLRSHFVEMRSGKPTIYPSVEEGRIVTGAVFQAVMKRHSDKLPEAILCHVNRRSGHLLLLFRLSELSQETHPRATVFLIRRIVNDKKSGFLFALAIMFHEPFSHQSRSSGGIGEGDVLPFRRHRQD